MHRIDSSSATTDNRFTEGSPTGGIPATVVTDDWLNDVQENIVAVILGSGGTLTKGRANDLLDAIKRLSGSGITGTATSVSGAFQLKLASGVVVQIAYGRVTLNVPNGEGSTVDVPFSFPAAFPTSAPFIVSGNNVASANTSEVAENLIGFTTKDRFGATCRGLRASGTNDGTETISVNYIAIGV